MSTTEIAGGQGRRPELPQAHGGWDFDPGTTLMRILKGNAEAFGAAVAFREKDCGIWKQMTWRELFEAVLSCAAALHSLGAGPDKVVLAIGDNRLRLYIGMLAASAVRSHAMPVYPDAAMEELRHFASEMAVEVAIAEDQEQIDKLLELRSAGAPIPRMVYADGRGMQNYEAPGLLSWENLLERGRQRLAAEPDLRARLESLALPDDPAILVHTSGTTGQPKGVCLSHRNLLAGVRNAWQGRAFDVGENILAYLPIAWMADFAFTIAAGLALRFTINVPERSETVAKDLREIAPTFYLASPRNWDNMLTSIQVRMADSTPLKRFVYRLFMDSALASERGKLEGKPPALTDRLLRPLGELMVFGPIKDQLGLTRLRHAFTAGEAIGEDTFIYYRALGVQLRQFYAQTECGAYNAMQDRDEVRLHTVGKPLPGVAVRISDAGEILVRSESVFGGYLQKHEGAQSALVDGWLRTGDAGMIEPDGHLVVLGRVSEIKFTARGERYIPNYIENRLKFSPYIKDAAVLGSGLEWLSALVCIDWESVGHWAELRGISYVSYADLSGKPEVADLVAEAVRRVNATLPEPLRLRHFVCLHKEFDADDGEITRTRKLKRTVVEARYACVIEAMYQGRQCVDMKAQVTYESGESGVIERRLEIRSV